MEKATGRSSSTIIRIAGISTRSLRSEFAPACYESPQCEAEDESHGQYGNERKRRRDILQAMLEVRAENGRQSCNGKEEGHQQIQPMS